MGISSEKQRELRATEGSSRQLAMQRWNKTHGPAAAKRWRERLKENPERKEEVLAARRAGTKTYELVQSHRTASVVVATRARQRWTLEEEKKLEDLRKAGVTCWEIGLMLGRSLQAIEHKLSALDTVRLQQASTEGAP